MSHPGIAIASIGVTLAIVLVTLVVGRGSERRASCRAALIPAYLPPRGIADLVRSTNRPRIVVINPNNGPGLAEHEAYRRAVREVRATGTRVLGYVATGYAARPAGDVVADVDRYLSWYGVDGIFFDEAASGEAALPYYAALARHVRSGADRLVVVNPGVAPARGYFDVADVVVTFEGAYVEYGAAVRAMPDWLRQEPPGRVAHLVYGASRAEALRAVADGAAGYVYATSGAMPNPWRTLPDYLSEEAEVLASCR
ncbi:MAG TPA: spherulation-specific family 4 protein [Baekduia sp.]|uniref:spherulation-specific family 4 protein n=1 Tax=Baekduia sp. TaxID=2600305 RepID=UPI002C06E382|nr:spherulation-specific family 4 protein [Baekduia sp.]HMJ33066.1 spherulation-specific family 4 protein [Baekduia sp.]